MTRVFSRDEWAALRANTPLDLDESDVDDLRGIVDRLDLDDIVDVYLPLSRLLDLHVVTSRDQSTVTDTFLGLLSAPRPFIIGVTGSVAVGKSTTSRILQALLSRWPAHPRVDIVTTDGFLLPNQVLIERGLLDRKGFPESYDRKALASFLDALASGTPRLRVPVYSHVRYDVMPDEFQVLEQPDVVILEGVNVLQLTSDGSRPASDFLDFSIYVDADERDIVAWFVQRFETFRETVFSDPSSFFQHFAAMSDEELRSTAQSVWRDINGVNLREHILPTRARAQLVLEKGGDHRVTRVVLRPK